MKRGVLALLCVAALPGCSSLLPRAEQATQQSWRDYESAKAAIETVVPMRSTRAELSKDGIDPLRNAAVTILTYSDVVQRFGTSPIPQEQLDPGVRQCLTAGKKCTGYSIALKQTTHRRIGNFWLDSFSFYRETDTTGWSFNALILFVEDTVVYTLQGGQPLVHEREVTRNPLGPLQGWGQQVTPLLY
jgi:hypothetical protein